MQMQSTAARMQGEQPFKVTTSPHGASRTMRRIMTTMIVRGVTQSTEAAEPRMGVTEASAQPPERAVLEQVLTHPSRQITH